VLRSAADLYQALWCHAQGRRGELLAAAALLVTAELMRLALPWLAGSAINAMQSDGMAGLVPAAKYLAVLFGVVVLAWALHGVGRVLERNVALRAREAFSAELMARLLGTPLRWHRREHPVAVSQRAIQGTEALHNFAESQYIYLQSAVQIAGPLIALWLISPWVGMAATAGFGVLCAISLGFDGVLLRLTDQKNEADRRNAATWSDILGNFLTVRALRLHAGVMVLAHKRLEAIFQPLRRLVLINELKWGAVDVFGCLLWCSLVVVYVIGSASSEREAAGMGAVALGGVFMVYEYSRRVESSMSALAADFSMLAGQLSGYRAAYPLMHAPRAEEAQAQGMPQATDWRLIELDSVSLHYEAADNAALRSASLRLLRGHRHALVGASGSGKTTLLMVLAGLETAAGGQVLRDGLAIDSAALRHEATLVPGQAALFEGSVQDNVSPGAQRDLPLVLQALACAGLMDFVHGLPQAFDTVVGDGAARWSMGQLQRLNLARGMLAAQGTGLLLLDEPTSHLDKTSARDVMARLLARHEDACVVSSLHDLDLLGHFDEVIVMDAGRVIDYGTVAEVIPRCAVLRGLMSSPEKESTHDALPPEKTDTRNRHETTCH
jgi:ATP-binding cassette, subfamily B, bacterial